MEQLSSKLKFIINFLYLCIIITISFFLIKYLLEPLLPFIIAFIIVSFSEKFITGISGFVGSKKTACVIFTILLIAVLSTIIYLLIFGLFSQGLQLSQNLSSQHFGDILESISKRLSGLLSFLSQNRLFSKGYEIVSEIIQSSDFDASGVISQAMPAVLKLLGRFLSFFPAAVIFICILFISLFYIGCDYDRIRDFLILQIPEKLNETIDETKTVIISTAKELFKSYFVLTFITFLLLFSGFIIIGIEYALLLAFIICLVDLLPILGTGTVLIPWAVICFLIENYKNAVGLLVLYGLITLFKQIAEPRIVGANIGLSPLLSLISLFVGFRLLGFIGILVFPIIIMTIIRLNEKGFIRLYKTFPEKKGDRINKTRSKFISFKRHDNN